MNTLLKKLKIINNINIYSNRWNIIRFIVDNLGKIKIIDKFWYDTYKQTNLEYYPLNLNKIETWSTFDNNCISIELYLDKNKVYLDIIIYDGDSFYGDRKNKRFFVKLQLPLKLLSNEYFKDCINDVFKNYLEQEYINHLISEKNKWMNKYEKYILKENK